MADLFSRAKTVDELEVHHKILLYGPPGSKKTTFCADAPTPLWWDFEQSTDILKARGLKIPGGKVINVTPKDSIPDVLAGMKKSLTHPDHETIVIDTIDSLQNWSLRKHMEAVEQGTTGTMTGKKDNSAGRTHLLPLWQDFRVSTEWLAEFFEACQTSDKTIVFISHVRDITRVSGDGTETKIGERPGMTPAISERLQGIIGVIAYMSLDANMQGKTTHKIQIGLTGAKRPAKNRTGIEEAVIEDPTWASVFGKGK